MGFREESTQGVDLIQFTKAQTNLPAAALCGTDGARLQQILIDGPGANPIPISEIKKQLRQQGRVRAAPPRCYCYTVGMR